MGWPDLAADPRFQGLSIHRRCNQATLQPGRAQYTDRITIGSGILELTLSIVFVFFFYRDGPRLATFVHGLQFAPDWRWGKVLQT